MKTLRLLVLGIGFSLALLSSAGAFSREPLTLYTSSNGIFSYSVDGREFEHHTDKISGTAVQFVKDLFDASGVEYEIKLRNLSVGMRRAKSEANVGFFAMSKDETDKKELIWIGPIARDYWSIYKKRNSEITIGSLNELSEYDVGAQKDSPIALFLHGAGIDVSVEPEDRVNPFRLHFDLIDFWATSRSSAFKLAFETGFPEIMEEQELMYIDLYLVLNASVEVGVVQALTTTYDEMIQKGRKWY